MNVGPVGVRDDGAIAAFPVPASAMTAAIAAFCVGSANRLSSSLAANHSAACSTT